MNTVSKVFSASLLTFSLLICSSANSQNAPQRFRDPRVEMPPGNLGLHTTGSAPGLLDRQPVENTKSASQLILERMELLEKKIELMERRLKQIEGGKK